MVVGSVLAAAALGGCGASTPTALPAGGLLAHARRVVDATRTVHFALSSAGVSPDGVQLLGGSGDLARPDVLSGSFTLQIDGVPVAAKVISVPSGFYIELPPAPYARANPDSYSFGDPAELISPTKGVSALLADMAPDARDDGQIRLDGELLDQVAGTIPGSRVPVLPDASPTQPVRMVAAIDPHSGQVRRVVLSGPFTSAKDTTTYTVTLSNYGETVHVSAPPT